MALPSTLVWEVRPTNGTADGGGGFDPSVASPGTDYSQQNTVQIAYTDLVVGTPNTTVTSAANAFTSAEVGNNICITTTGGGAAWTVGHYNIRSVAAGVATLDRSPAATASTAGVGNLGGARSGFSTGVTAIQAAYVSGNYIYVKNEAWNEAVNMTVAGAAGSPVVVEGYNSTRGDFWTAGANRPLLNRASAAGDGFTIGATNIEIRGIRVTAAGDAGFAMSAANNPKLIYCKSYSNTNEGIESGNSQFLFMINCEISSNGTGATTSASPSMIGCYVHDNAGKGLQSGSSQLIGAFNLIVANAGNGVEATTANFFFINNTVDGNIGAAVDGYSCTTPTQGTIMMNNIFSNNGRYGVNATDADSIWEDYNCFFGNGTAPRNPANGSAGAWQHLNQVSNDVTTDPTYTGTGKKTFVDGDVNTGTENITVTAHGFTAGSVAVLTSTGTLPAGLALNTAYYVLVTDANTIQLSATRGGAAVNITAAAGGGTHTIKVANTADYSVGTNMKAMGFPGMFPGSNTTGYLDIGAVQRVEPTGGGGESPYSFG